MYSVPLQTKHASRMLRLVGMNRASKLAELLLSPLQGARTSCLVLTPYKTTVAYRISCTSTIEQAAIISGMAVGDDKRVLMRSPVSEPSSEVTSTVSPGIMNLKYVCIQIPIRQWSKAAQGSTSARKDM